MARDSSGGVLGDARLQGRLCCPRAPGEASCPEKAVVSCSVIWLLVWWCRDVSVRNAVGQSRRRLWKAADDPPPCHISLKHQGQHSVLQDERLLPALVRALLPGEGVGLPPRRSRQAPRGAPRQGDLGAVRSGQHVDDHIPSGHAGALDGDGAPNALRQELLKHVVVELRPASRRNRGCECKAANDQSARQGCHPLGAVRLGLVRRRQGRRLGMQPRYERVVRHGQSWRRPCLWRRRLRC
mmetsp:Transcript_60259/g.179470  ORF Transcript_60259/g.179470 Transcript_60259/m.179470 type:complete len:240 (-) Transcript_60259:185-904(-)